MSTIDLFHPERGVLSNAFRVDEIAQGRRPKEITPEEITPESPVLGAEVTIVPVEQVPEARVMTDMEEAAQPWMGLATEQLQARLTEQAIAADVRSLQAQLHARQ